jgi:hypothetical protein
MKSIYKGFEIIIEPDEFPQDPRKSGHADKMVCFHRRYSFPNEIDYTEADIFSSWDDLREKIAADFPGVNILPIYLYDHSGLYIRTTPFSCPWDSGQIGFIFGHSPCEYLEFQVDEYHHYQSGDIWAYTIIRNGEVMDTCGGYYGSSQAMIAAKADIKFHLKFEAENYGVQLDLFKEGV